MTTGAITGTINITGTVAVAARNSAALSVLRNVDASGSTNFSLGYKHHTRSSGNSYTLTNPLHFVVESAY